VLGHNRRKARSVRRLALPAKRRFPTAVHARYFTRNATLDHSEGLAKKGKSPHHSAAREAFEEAGVVGAVARRSVGSFSYEKRLKTVAPSSVKCASFHLKYGARINNGQKTGSRCEVALRLTGGGKGKGTKVKRDHYFAWRVNMIEPAARAASGHATAAPPSAASNSRRPTRKWKDTMSPACSLYVCPRCRRLLQIGKSDIRRHA